MRESARQERFVRLIEEHRRILFKVASTYCPAPSEREDLVQEMLLQLWRGFDTYDTQRKFSTWMYRVALNVAISYFRGETRRAHSVVPVNDAMLEVVFDGPAAGDDEELRLLHRFIGELGPLDRGLVVLYLDGHSYAEIAEVFGIFESNVGTRLGRIKAKLRRYWDDHLQKEAASWNSKN